MKTIINLIKNKVSLVTGLILMSILSYGQMSLTTTGVAVTQNFNSIGNTATASLPSGFRLGQNVAYSSGVSNTTAAAGTSGAGIIATTGGYYNFGDGVNSSSTDRSVGVLTSSGFISPRDLMLQIQNNTGGIVTDLALTFKYEKYRSGTRMFDIKFFVGTDGSTWTPLTSGDQNYPADANNTTVSNPPTSITKNINVTGLNITNGGFYYLKWSIIGNGGSSNGQALGLDDISVTPTTPQPSISISSIPNFSTIGGVTAPIQSYTVSGANLIQNLTIQPFNSNFEISTDGVNFSAGAILLTQSGGVVNPTTIYVKMVPTTVGTFTGSISHSSSGATLQTQNLTGTVVPSTWYSVASGNINGAAVWSSTPTGSPDPIAYSKFRTDVSLIIQNGHTIALPSSLGATNVKDLTINSGGKLWRNSSSTANMVYLNVYGNIVNNGEIGNGTTFDACGFNIEGNCSVQGTGIFNLGRVRKNTTSPISSLTIQTDSVNVRFPGLALYNAVDNTSLTVTVPTGKKLLLPQGEFSLTSTNGTGNNSNMIVSVNGTFTALGSGTSYIINLSTLSIPSAPVDNTNPCSFTMNIGSKVSIRNLDIRQTTVSNLNINGGNLSVFGTMRVFAGSVSTNNCLTIENGGNLLSGTGFTYPYVPSGGVVTGNVKVRKTGNTGFGEYNFWSSPITNATLNTITQNGSLAGSPLNTYEYNPTLVTTEIQDGWVNVSPSSTMSVGKGYITTGAGSVVFNGPVNDGTVNAPTQQGIGTNFNLVGNPYPSSLTSSTFLTTNGISALYLWDDDASNGVDYQSGDYIVVGTLGVVSGSQSTPSPTINSISPCQGFFVQTNSSSVTFNNTMRSSGTSTFFEEDPIQRFWLNAVSPSQDYKETLIAFKEDATFNKDTAYDAEVFGSIPNPQFDFWSKSQDDFNLTIQAIPNTGFDMEIPLGFNSQELGEHVISLGNVENLDGTTLFILEDKTLNLFHSLRQSPYIFSITQPELGDDRFVLHIKKPVSVNGGLTNCIGTGGDIVIDGSSDWTYLVNDQVGQLNDTLVTTIENLAAGDYLVYLYHGSYVITKSVTIGSSTPVSININNFISPLVVGEPFTLSFEVEGAFNPQIWYGDESDITESPIHTYNEPGVYVITIIASNDYCSGIGQIEVSVIGQTTSIDNPTFNYDFYPNPANHIINFKSYQQKTIVVYNSVGQVVKNELVTNQLSLEDLNEGVYILLVDGKTHKLIVNK
jgi:hypothetical protein